MSDGLSHGQGRVNCVVSLTLLSVAQRYRPDASWWTYAQPVVFSTAILILALVLRQLSSCFAAALRLCPPLERPRRYEDTWTLMSISLMAAVGVGLSVFAAALRASCALGAFCAGISFSGVDGAAGAWRRCAQPCTRWLAVAFFACSVGFVASPAAWDAGAVGDGLTLAAVSVGARLLCGAFAARATCGSILGLLAATRAGASTVRPGEAGFFILIELSRRGLVGPRSTQAVLWALVASSAAGPALLRALGGPATPPAGPELPQVSEEGEDPADLKPVRAATTDCTVASAGAGRARWLPSGTRRGQGQRMRPPQEIEPLPVTRGIGAKAMRDALLSRAGTSAGLCSGTPAAAAAGLDDSACSAAPLLPGSRSDGPSKAEAEAATCTLTLASTAASDAFPGLERDDTDASGAGGGEAGGGGSVSMLDVSCGSDFAPSSEGCGGGGGIDGEDWDAGPLLAAPAALDPLQQSDRLDVVPQPFEPVRHKGQAGLLGGSDGGSIANHPTAARWAGPSFGPASTALRAEVVSSAAASRRSSLGPNSAAEPRGPATLESWWPAAESGRHDGRPCGIGGVDMSGSGWRAQSLATLAVRGQIGRPIPLLWADSDDSDAAEAY